MAAETVKRKLTAILAADAVGCGGPMAGDEGRARCPAHLSRRPCRFLHLSLMDFFQHQEEARGRTTLLVAYFVLAVVLIIAAVSGVVMFFLGPSFTGGTGAVSGEPLAGESLWNLDVFLVVAAATITVVALGSLHKINALSGGGRVVAEGLGATPVDPEAADPLERRLLNVVEEMAIASGMPVPAVYVMRNEPGINAFAAGYSSADAVVAVTRGALETLSRDGLQGVIAHEFSHILNGDMRINIRLIGVLNGILIIGIIGQRILSSARYVGRRGKVAVALLGLSIIVIGCIGVFFGRLIKASLSRQREFLADASAVQFTRNPGGLAGALKKIGGVAAGSELAAPDAETASHLFFADGLVRSVPLLFATHPPLAERISRLDPQWDGTYPAILIDHFGADEEETDAGSAATTAQGDGAITGTAEILARIPLSAERSIAFAGTVTPAHLVYARAVVSELPPIVATAAREPYGARALVYALLLSRDGAVRRNQIARLHKIADAGVLAELEKILPAIDGISRKTFLPLVDLSLPALRTLSRHQYKDFRGIAGELIAEDERMSPFEFAMLRVLRHHLDGHFSGRARTRGGRAMRELAQECGVLLSALSHVGHEDPDAAASAYRTGMSRLGIVDPLSGVPADMAHSGSAGRALDALVQLQPMAKRELVAACAATISRDGQVTLEEAELFRAVVDSLDVPMPPFLEDRWER